MQRLLTLAASAVVLLGAVQTANAADYPTKAVTYIIPYNPGGESDVTARFQEGYFKDVAGQDVVIQYKPGAGGATAWAQLNGYEPDGYTIMNVNFPHAILQPSMKDVGYQTEDVKPAFVFHYTPDAILVRADSPYQTLQDLIDDAKANPGATTFSGSGTNSANHLATVRFDQMMGTKSTYIPFKGSAPSMAALLGGQVKAAMSYTTQGIKAGDQVRVLAIATEERVAAYPDVPTFKELGFDYVAGAYRGVTLPKDAPQEVRQKVSDIIGQINANPDFKKKLEENGYVVTDIPHDKVDQFIADRRAEYASAIEALKAAK
ncbi:tripartite tricarboxylate transporter substrate binding protein [Pelagibius litoralis]|uniref:Tripartite tricarboxylate transporter substrate binding protein n=1 Tax=Pelagibius litoralis TaxID=374515 RepID=A0A967C272_9PROT|nr:tripartite tricarboxylate transporter substrate binding protein [Pelagibius litoralis]NIA67973.1 tripartite tricarboxylate transporter substrate binding protein [Pelagibius litoralis]